MGIIRFFLKRHRVTHLLDPSGQQGVFDEAAFHCVMKRERDRSDRSGRSFSLVEIRLPSSRERGVEDRILNILARRIRITDMMGWLGPARLGVFLADTPPDGARIFLKRIIPPMSDIGSLPDIRIHTYPDKPAAGDSAEKTGDGGENRASASGGGGTPPEKNDNTPQNDPVALDGGGFVAEILAVGPPRTEQIMERIAAGMLLVVLSPLLLLIALTIKLCSPGPVLFRQERIGIGGNSFYCHKFRTMHLNSETETHEDYFHYLMNTPVPMRKLDGAGDKRVFPVGRLLRASSLDELPQLFNVFRGEMRLIGPRPCTPHEYDDYQPWHRHRTDSLPGLTGLWQVSGKNKTTFAEMIRLDRKYIRKQSMLMDLIIVLKTIPVVVGQYLEERVISKKNRSSEKDTLRDAPFLNAVRNKPDKSLEEKTT